MILKLTICGLSILLVVVIALSYHVNKEGFATMDMSAQAHALVQAKAINDVIDIVAKASSNGQSAAIQGAVTTVKNAVQAKLLTQTPEVISAFASVLHSGLAFLSKAPASHLQDEIRSIVKNVVVFASDIQKPGLAPATRTTVIKQIIDGTFTNLSNGQSSAMKSSLTTVNTVVQNAFGSMDPAVTSAVSTLLNAIAVIPAAGQATTAQTIVTLINSAKTDAVLMKSIVAMAPAPSVAPTVAPSVAPTVAPIHAPAQHVELSDIGYTAMSLQNKSDLLKDIQMVVKNELLAGRAMDDNTKRGHFVNSATNSTAQGQEYEATSMHGLHKNAQRANASHMNASHCGTNGAACGANDVQGAEEHGAQFGASCNHDMNQYIKKDSIPCWGCSLDY